MGKHSAASWAERQLSDLKDGSTTKEVEILEPGRIAKSEETGRRCQWYSAKPTVHSQPEQPERPPERRGQLHLLKWRQWRDRAEEKRNQDVGRGGETLWQRLLALPKRVQEDQANRQGRLRSRVHGSEEGCLVVIADTILRDKVVSKAKQCLQERL